MVGRLADVVALEDNEHLFPESHVRRHKAPRPNRKPIKRSSFEKFFLAKRAIVEAVIGQLKEICQIEHSRHPKPDNFLVNLIATLAAYTLKPRKPSINLNTITKAEIIPS